MRFEIPKTAGVYFFKHVRSGKVYVGSAQNIRQRFFYHRSFLRRGKHDNQYFQRAWLKYGEPAFVFGILELCKPSRCLKREQYWINKLDASSRTKGYNICPAAGFAMLGRKHSVESCKKMSEKRKGIIPVAATKAAAKATRGVPRSAEVRAKISAGNKGRPKSAAHIAAVKKHHWSKGPNARKIVRRMSRKLRGRTLSVQHRQNISEGFRRRREAFS